MTASSSSPNRAGRSRPSIALLIDAGLLAGRTSEISGLRQLGLAPTATGLHDLSDALTDAHNLTVLVDLLREAPARFGGPAWRPTGRPGGPGRAAHWRTGAIAEPDTADDL